MLTYLLWFLGGALLHKIFTTILGIGLERVLVDKTLLMAGMVFTAISSDVQNAIAAKHKHLRESGLPTDVVDKIIKSDELFLSKWKIKIFTAIVLSLPPKYIRNLPHYIWDKDISLEEIVKKLQEEKRDEY